MNPRDVAFLRRELTGSPVFAAMPIKAHDQFAVAARKIVFGDGLTVCGAEEVLRHLYLIQSGRMEIRAGSRDGEEMTLAVIGQGGWLTWLGVLDPVPLRHELFGVKGGTAIAIPAALVRQLIGEHPAAYPYAITEIGNRMRALMGWVENAALHDRDRRLAHLLLAINGTSGDGSRVAMSQSQLAQLIGCSRQTLAQSLARLAGLGLVRRSYGGVELIDRIALMRFAD